MHGVPPRGKIQLLHMAEEEEEEEDDDEEWKESEVGFREESRGAVRPILRRGVLIKQTKQFPPLASQMSSPPLFLHLLISPNISLAV